MPVESERYGARLRQRPYVKKHIVDSQSEDNIGPPGAEEGARRSNVARELRRRNLPGDETAASWIDHYNALRRDDGSWSV